MNHKMLEKCVVAFDLDDTLAQEALFLKSGVRHMSHIVSAMFPVIPPAIIEGCMDMAIDCHENHYGALEKLLDKYGVLPLSDMSALVGEMRNHRPDPDIYHLAPSTESALKCLNNLGATLALVTDGRSVTQRHKIDSLGLSRFMNDADILISGETGYDKTSPHSFLHLQQYHPNAERFIYIGDNPRKDFIHPRLLGWETMRVTPFPLGYNCSGITPKDTLDIVCIGQLPDILLKPLKLNVS